MLRASERSRRMGMSVQVELTAHSPSLPTIVAAAAVAAAPCFVHPSAKLSHEGSSGAEQRHVTQDMACVVESAIQSLEQQQREQQQQQTAPSDPSAASAETESQAAESTAVRSAAGHPLSESALHDALVIPPPRELQPHARDPVSAGKQIPSTFKSVCAIASRTSRHTLSAALSVTPLMTGRSACSCE